MNQLDDYVRGWLGCLRSVYSESFLEWINNHCKVVIKDQKGDIKVIEWK